MKTKPLSNRALAGGGALAPSSAPPRRGLTHRTALITPVALVLLAAIPIVLQRPFYLHLAVLVAINAIAVTGLAILTRTGQVSLCHGAFVGIGAYVCALASMRLNLPFALAALCATVCAAGVALLLGFVMLRLRGVYFVLLTFAFGEFVRLVMLAWESMTGGANGIAGIPPASLFGFALDSSLSFYCLAAGLALLSIGALVALFRSPAGHTIEAVGENAALAEASGLGVRRTQHFAFTAAGAFAGLSGALLAPYIGFVSPESFQYGLSVSLIIMLVVGGRRYALGPLVGALIMTPLPELFRGAVQTQNIFYGCALILILRFMPQGLASVPGRFAARFAAHFRRPQRGAQ
ncbi:amino acid/amide ABC transporter membrane protein 2 (HAAT family) [Paraburkholderia unamae]|uniref:branched-chain amino acid ABC transporter permease n=1 Tax=Paraburkholderia unamae TaxID=219649 RepID=UPI000DC2DDB5|nr:branched-chain amino acid ABC transporter permease [Paraburkholderia unamae]RAR57926.1 amino acid/amide ABC transporter membrane protein 2 (HAAT family) [Paraburkholderia unamae]